MSHMRQYIQVLAHLDPTDTGLYRHWRGLPPWSSEFQIRPLILLRIQYSPLSPNCFARSHIEPFYQQIIFLNHSSLESGYKKP
jgi:hypothetical protein